jgi:hypothetical protein
MATERDFELLDDYLTNRLTGEDKSAFERKLQADPDLQTEKLMQERLIKSIQQARIAELKTMFNNIPVAPVSQGGASVVAKYAAGTIVAGMVATGLYFYFNKTEAVQTPTENVIASEEGKANQGTQPNTTATENKDGKQVQTTEAKPEVSATESTSPKEGANPNLDVYEPTNEEAQSTSNDVEDAAGERSNAVKSGAPAPKAEVDSHNNAYKFNYQFKDGKLYLYGPFERNLYEIMEFFSGDKPTTFLYYKNNYYLLNDEGGEVKTLTPIADQNLIRKLRKSRGN